MLKRIMPLALLLLLGAAPAPRPATCTDDSAWDAPGPPVRIAANAWWVGTCGIAAVLVTGPKGHVLIDGGVEAAAPLVAANIARAGFRMKDIKAIVFSHAHFDHVGALAALQRASGAPVYGFEADAAALEAGHGGPDDPQAHSAKGFAAIAHVRRLHEGEVLRVGPLALTAIATFGHTPGGSSWFWRACDQRGCEQIVYANSLSAISENGFRFSASPRRAATFAASIAAIGALRCDVLITPHPGVSDFWERFGPSPTEPRRDPAACRKLAEAASKDLNDRLETETKGVK